jgi:ComF family protein
MRKFVELILDLLLPYHCLACGMITLSHIMICNGCLDELPYLHHSCALCAQPLSTANSSICGQCLQARPIIFRTIAAFHYRPPISHFITQLKFNQRLIYAQTLARLMIIKIKSSYQPQDLPEYILPVPLHRSRLRERGFNQALLIAKLIAKELNLKIDCNHYYRNRPTRPQAQLSAKLRHQNIKGAFARRGGFKAAHVAILDDVMTTGQTVRELAICLKQAGVKKIEVWCCARA